MIFILQLLRGRDQGEQELPVQNEANDCDNKIKCSEFNQFG